MEKFISKGKNAINYIKLKSIIEAYQDIKDLHKVVKYIIKKFKNLNKHKFRIRPGINSVTSEGHWSLKKFFKFWGSRPIFENMETNKKSELSARARSLPPTVRHHQVLLTQAEVEYLIIVHSNQRVFVIRDNNNYVYKGKGKEKDMED